MPGVNNRSRHFKSARYVFGDHEFQLDLTDDNTMWQLDDHSKRHIRNVLFCARQVASTTAGPGASQQFNQYCDEVGCWGPTRLRVKESCHKKMRELIVDQLKRMNLHCRKEFCTTRRSDKKWFDPPSTTERRRNKIEFSAWFLEECTGKKENDVMVFCPSDEKAKRMAENAEIDRAQRRGAGRSDDQDGDFGDRFSNFIAHDEKERHTPAKIEENEFEETYDESFEIPPFVVPQAVSRNMQTDAAFEDFETPESPSPVAVGTPKDARQIDQLNIGGLALQTPRKGTGRSLHAVGEGRASSDADSIFEGFSRGRSAYPTVETSAGRVNPQQTPRRHDRVLAVTPTRIAKPTPSLSVGSRQRPLSKIIGNRNTPASDVMASIIDGGLPGRRSGTK